MQARKYRGCGGTTPPQSFTQSEKPESSGRFKSFQQKLGQSEFKMGTNYTIQLGNWTEITYEAIYKVMLH